MAIKFSTIGQIEHGEYPFEPAVASTDTFNGAFGTVEGGKFSVAANASKAIMNIEVGDNAGLDTYPIAKDTQLRVIDLSKLNGKTIEIYGDEIPSGVVKGDKLMSGADGSLVKGATTVPYYEVTKVLPNVKGVEATAVTAAPANASSDAEGKE